MFKPQFINNEIYHIYNQGVDKRIIHLDKQDRFRFVHDLFEFNDVNPALPSNVKFNLRKPAQFQCLDLRNLNISIETTIKPRELLVEILIWCLMPNHFHLLLRQLKEGGVTLFMKKLGAGYANYFNQKYERIGALFQGRFKAVLVKSERHFIHLPFYIHCNPLDLIEPGWRQGKISNWQKAIKFLENYRWSSHPDYLGKKNFPSVSQREFLLDIFGGQANYKKQMEGWLKAMSAEELQEQLTGLAIES